MSFLFELWRDYEAIRVNDPACHSSIEALVCYPGLWALACYRVAHFLHVHRVPLLPRVISTAARVLTAIDIHPAAKLGSGLFLDHGIGVVIGETAVVGTNCILFQGVTLGGTGKQKGKRHPTLGNSVLVGAGAKVLGSITLGDNVRVGAQSVVVKDVPNGCTVVGVPGKILVKSASPPSIDDQSRTSSPTSTDFSSSTPVRPSGRGMHQQGRGGASAGADAGAGADADADDDDNVDGHLRYRPRREQSTGKTVAAENSQREVLPRSTDGLAESFTTTLSSSSSSSTTTAAASVRRKRLRVGREDMPDVDGAALEMLFEQVKQLRSAVCMALDKQASLDVVPDFEVARWKRQLAECEMPGDVYDGSVLEDGEGI
eukprot:ANDGO_00352.mRNA.1 Serine acetyltransferase